MKTSKVKLRKRLLKSGKEYSLYLDFYPPVHNPRTNKATRRESLGIRMVVKPKDELEQIHNKNTYLRARKICSERQQQIFENDFGFLASDLEEKDFLFYFEELAKRKGRSSSNRAIWLIVLDYLKEFSPEIKIKHLDLIFINDFRDFLLSKPHFRAKSRSISQNTALSYFSKFIFSLKSAYKDGVIKENIAPKIERIKAIEVKKEFLTKEEAIRLKETPCKDEMQKLICLFMIYTGLRISDVQKLVWSNVEHSNEVGYFIRFQHKKTRTQQTQIFSDKAYALLPKRGEPDEKVFKGFIRKYRVLKQWAKDAEITKNIGYHTFRHTYATLLLNANVSIFTVKEMLGHKEIKTTMNYANLLNKNKIEAANIIEL